MNILVTGCVGFIGYHLSQKLLDMNYDVFGIDNFDPFYDPNFKKENLEKLSKHENFHFFDLDLRDEGQIGMLFANLNFDYLIHLAARAGVRSSVKMPISYIEYNIKVTNLLLEECVKNNIKNFIFGSSSSVYGNIQGPFKEEMLPKPISPYAASKRSCELYGYTYTSLYDINFTALRFFTVYGPCQRPTMAISKFTDWIAKDLPVEVYGDGTTERDYTYIDDIVDGILKSMGKMSGFKIYNLGGGSTIILKNLIKLIEQKLEKKAVLKFLPKEKGDVDLTCSDNSKAYEEIGYEPKVSIEKGIGMFVDWYSKRNKKT